MESQSHVSIRTSQLLVLTADCLERVKVAAEAARQNAIAHERKKAAARRAHWFWRLLVPAAMPTDEQIAADIEMREYWDKPWVDYAWGRVAAARRLSLLAKHGDPVMVTADDLALIAG